MRSLLPLLPKPSHYAGIEDNACRKDPQKVSLRVALAFPDTYDVGMSYLGQKILYGIVNSEPRWWAERVMAPELEVAEILRAHAAPLATLESDTPLAHMHCLSFSITHELCYTNVLYMLDLAGIPLRSRERPQDLRACPLVIAGGGALLSAEPLTPFMDMMVLGDGEESLPDILSLLETAHERAWTRTRFLEEARHIPGVYVPSLFQPESPEPDAPLVPLFADYCRPARRIVARMDSAAYPTRQVVPIGAVHNRLSLEIARGCTRGCRFCHAGMVYRPVRERSLENINSLLSHCLRETGFDEISFLSLSTGDFSALKTLSLGVLERCAHDQISLSLPSLRVGSIDDEIIERMADLRRTGCTLAPEAGSQRLRDVINKGVSEEELLLHAQKLLEHGWRMVKLYFMIGLPTETDEDLSSIVETCRKVRDAAGPGGPRLQVTAALSPFVPKPFTPFQWEEQIGLEEIRRRIDLIRSQFKGQKFLKVRWHEPEMSHLEGILSRADRRMADVVEKAYRKGAVFCSWVEHFDLTPWLDALHECGIQPRQYTGPRHTDAPLPWGHLEAGVSDAFLLRERQRALAGKTTDDCRYGRCQDCGACDRPEKPSRLPHASPAPAEHRNILVFAQRDQAAHLPGRDAEGKLVCRVQTKRPPRIAPHLTHKAVQYRVWHKKTDNSAYLSQLELLSVLDRALRRAGMPLAFSQGFHPLPLLSFGRALPVGVESEAEWFGLTLHSFLAPREVASRLEPFLPPGISVLAVVPTTKSDYTRQAVAEVFRLSFPSPQENAAAAQCFARLEAADEKLFVRDTKKGPRTVNIRPVLRSWATLPTALPIAWGEDGREADGVKAVTFTADWSTLYLSPSLLIKAILADTQAQDSLPRARLTKTAQIFDNGQTYP